MPQISQKAQIKSVVICEFCGVMVTSENSSFRFLPYFSIFAPLMYSRVLGIQGLYLSWLEHPARKREGSRKQ